MMRDGGRRRDPLAVEWFINEDPLVSRAGHDSAAMVEVIRSFRPASVLDVGTGSGYIAVACALAGASVDAVDIDTNALQVARENARRAGVDVRFTRSDLLQSLEEGRTFDVVAFNPPVLPASAYSGLTLGWMNKIRRSDALTRVALHVAEPFARGPRLRLLGRLFDEVGARTRRLHHVVLFTSPTERDMLSCALSSHALVRSVESSYGWVVTAWCGPPWDSRAS
jgi:methylase of polypeptide subunit release factors